MTLQGIIRTALESALWEASAEGDGRPYIQDDGSAGFTLDGEFDLGRIAKLIAEAVERQNG
jgi:hypothetical protein